MTNQASQGSVDRRSAGGLGARRFRDWVWGYDFFISYNQESSHRYATVLAERLRRDGHEVFIDHDEIPAGGDLSETIQQAISRARSLIVIGTQKALGGEKSWVAREILLFKRTNRQCFPILFPDSFELPAPDADRDAARRYLQDEERLHIKETLANLQAGHPDETAVVEKLKSSLKVMKRRKLRRLITLIVFALLTTFSTVSVIFAIRATVSEGNALEEQRKATFEFHKSEKSRAEFFIQNGYRAIHSDHDIAAGVAWYSKTLETQGPLAQPFRDSARFLIGGWSRALPLRSLVHEDGVRFVAFSPDGTTTATISRVGEVSLWDTHTGKRRTGLPDGPRVESLAFSPDGRTLATAELDNSVAFRDAETGRRRNESISDAGRVFAIAYSPDGRLLATATHDRTVRLWDAKTKEPAGAEFSPDEYLESIAFSPDSRTLAVGTQHFAVWLRDTETGQWRDGGPLRVDGEVRQVAFSPDGGTIAILSGDSRYVRHQGEVTLWNATDGTKLGDPLKANGPVQGLAFSPDGGTLALACGVPDQRHGEVSVWDPSTRRMRGTPVRYNDVVNSVAFSADGKLLATACADHFVRIQPARKWRETREAADHGDHITSLSLSDDGRIAATGSLNGTAQLWDTSTWQPMSDGPLKHNGTVYSIAFGPNSGTVAMGTSSSYGQSGSVSVWHTHQGTRRHEPLPHSHGIESVTYSSDGRWLAAATSRVLSPGRVRIWNAKTWERLGELPSEGNHVAAFSPDSLTLVTGGNDGHVRVWDTQTFGQTPLARQQPVQTLPHGGEVSALSFSPDGRKLAVATTLDDLGEVRLWDADHWQSFGDPLRHDLSVQSVAFSPDSRRLATATDTVSTPGAREHFECSVTIWDAESGLPIGMPLRQISQNQEVLFSSDGTTLAVVDGNNVRIWDMLPPAVDEPNRVRLSVEVRTARTIAGGRVRPLDRTEWLDRKRRLDALGGDCLCRTWDDLTEAEWADLRRPPSGTDRSTR